MAQSKQPPTPEEFVPTVEFFRKLEKKIGVLKDAKDDNNAMPRAEMLHLQAVEWLRLESLKRAYPDTSNIPVDPNLQPELEYVGRGEHSWLIHAPNNPPNSWNISGTLPPFIQKLAAVLEVKPGQTIFGPYRVSIPHLFSVDLAQTNRAISEAFIEGYIKPLREKVFPSSVRTTQNKRSKGGGRKYSLAKLWEVLTLYDEYKNEGCSQRSLGEKAETFKPGNSETRQGEKIIQMANNMIALSATSPEFHQTFG